MRKRWTVLYIAILVLLVLSFWLPLGHYLKGYASYIIGDYTSASNHFYWCNGFLNSEKIYQKATYEEAVSALYGKGFHKGNQIGWETAYERLKKADGEESATEEAYQAAERRFQRADYVGAYEIYKYLAEELTPSYKDSVAQKKKAAYYMGVYYYNQDQLIAAYQSFVEADDYIIGLDREEWVRKFIEKYSDESTQKEEYLREIMKEYSK